MKLEHRAAIEEHYGIRIETCEAGPRQYVAETHILGDTKGKRYFCKIVDKPLFIPEIIRSLPAVAELHAKGIERINYPIASSEGFHLIMGSTLIALFNYISGQQSYEYSLFELGKLFGHIHAITPSVQLNVPEETFEFDYHHEFEQCFEDTLAAQHSDSVLLSLRGVLLAHEGEIRRCLSIFQRLSAQCKKHSWAFVVTHGDGPGNVLVKSFDDIYLIDWDEIMLAPAERDIWMIDQHPAFLEGYKTVRPTFVTNSMLRSFCICKYYFRSMMHYFSEILGVFDNAYRLRHLRDFEENLLNGWMLPKLNELES